MTLDDDQTPRRPRGRPRLPTSNGRSEALAALARRNQFIATGMWPERRFDHPESLNETLARRVHDDKEIETCSTQIFLEN
jgi:hypothetical protein